MNLENPSDPRQALEPSLTALLMGELPDDQARLVRQAISADPDLAKTFERLKATTEILRQMETGVRATNSAVQERSPKLSEERRLELLQRFRTVSPAELRQAPRQWNSWLVAAAAVVMALAMVTAVLMRVSFKSKTQSMAKLDLKSESVMPRKAPSLSDRASRSGVIDSFDSPVLAERLERELGRTETPVASTHLGIAKPAAITSLSRNSGTREAKHDQDFIASYRLPAGGQPRSDAQPPPATPRQTIVLPADNTKEVQETDIVGGTPQSSATQLWSMSAPRASFEGIPSGGGGLGGGAPSAQVPVLGDVPEAGSLFFFRGKVLNASGLQVTQAAQSAQDKGVAFKSANENVSSAKDNYALDGRVLTAGDSVESGLVSRSGFVDAEKRPERGMGEELSRKLSEARQFEPPKSDLLAQLQTTTNVPEVAQNAVLPAVRDEKDKAELAGRAGATLDDRLAELKVVELKKQQDENLRRFGLTPGSGNLADQQDLPSAKPAAQAAPAQPEIQTSQNAFSTFSLNVSDVSFKLAASSLEQGKLPDPASIRSEEFINAFDYRDPEPANGQPVAFAWERARYPFAQNHDLVRFSVKTAAAGRETGRRLNIVLLLDNSGSMERADRVRIIHEGLRVLAGQLHPGDVFSVVTFARTARLWVDGVPGDQAGRVADDLNGLTPQGGTNLEEAMNLAYQTAQRHYLADGINRVVLLTDGAANLGDTSPEALKQKVESNRKQGVALDCFGIGWEGYNDDLLEQLSRNGDGRYGFLNSPEEAAADFAGQLAGALHVAASDVKVQVEFNPKRVASYRQIGYAHHQLTKEQFRDNTVDAAEIGAAEAGNALYVIETNPQGDGPLATLHVRYKIPGTSDYREHEWVVPYTGNAAALEQSSPSIRLAGTAGAFSEWLASSPYAAEVTPDRLIGYLNNVSAVYGADPRPQKLEWMIRQANAISGK